MAAITAPLAPCSPLSPSLARSGVEPGPSNQHLVLGMGGGGVGNIPQDEANAMENEERLQHRGLASQAAMLS